MPTPPRKPTAGPSPPVPAAEVKPVDPQAEMERPPPPALLTPTEAAMKFSGPVAMAPMPQPMPLPPGVPASPWSVYAVAGATTIVTEALNLSLISGHTAQVIIGFAGVVLPAVVAVADSIIRHAHTPQAPKQAKLKGLW